MRKSQFDEISDLLLSYSAGEYHVKGNISKNFDEIDMIISGINMLGEELLSTNVSKDYFLSIFNTVTDLVMITDEKGKLLEFNKSVIVHTGYSRSELSTVKLIRLLSKENENLFNKIVRELEGEKNNYVVESEIITKQGGVIFGLFTCSKIFDRFGKFNGYLISVKDITEEKEHEKLILKTIISTQSAEQSRVADDLHDSLGQELSMAQLMLSNFNRFKVDDQEFYNLIELCKEILENSIKRLREICFDLMPNVLVKGGLELAVDTLVGKLQNHDNIEVDFVSTENFPRLFSELEIVIYRIIQEFINNMIKHSDATQLNIHLIEDEDLVEIKLKENGQGFEMAKLKNIGENRGVSNIGTKVRAFNGQHELKSKPGEGTGLWVKFPKNSIMDKIKILIADDHKLVRTGIRYTLTGGDNANFIERIDEVVNGKEAVERAKIFNYDVILMDINMPEMDGIKATAQVMKDNPEAKVIALSMHSDDYEIRSMIKAGAKGYLLKNTGSEVLADAIKTVLDGGKYYSNEVALKLMEPYNGDLSTTKGSVNKIDKRKISLTRRELEVLRLIANEYTNEEIAKKFELSKRTIDSHRQNILSKLQVKNTAGLIKYAIKLGLV